MHWITPNMLIDSTPYMRVLCSNMRRNMLTSHKQPTWVIYVGVRNSWHEVFGVIGQMCGRVRAD